MSQQSVENTGVDTIGYRLMLKREQANLSVDYVAEKLNLPQKIIKALENNHFTFTPGPIFMRGYLRSYAKILDLSVNDVLTEFDNLRLQMVKSSNPMLASSIIFQPTNTLAEKSMRWVSILVMFSFLVLVGAWWYTHNTDFATELSSPEIVGLAHAKISPAKNTTEIAQLTKLPSENANSVLALAIPEQKTQEILTTILPDLTKQSAQADEIEVALSDEQDVEEDA